MEHTLSAEQEVYKSSRLTSSVPPQRRFSKRFGSMVIKSLGLYIAYGTPFQTIVFRVVTASVSAVIDATIVWALMQNKSFMKEIGRIIKR